MGILIRNISNSKANSKWEIYVVILSEIRTKAINTMPTD